ncbi:NADH-quinone oxidoreductase subunit NuoG [Aggregatilineales bacterium SYSU G02658]
MSDKLVKVIIDDKEYMLPQGANLVDAAKWSADTDIPVFCYHPKMAPVGMCRMCVVEQGMIEKDRATGEVVMENGQPKIRWMPKLQTACTQLVSDGMVVRTNTPKVLAGRESVIEFLLTSHPLDCPICDKGGECPLQNLTMAHGKGVSRMDFSDKMHLDKHVPLGDLIYLDEERCIQCARCIRFQDEVVGDDVLAFHERGRRLQIITKSDPGFDTYFSGNTTDICPVGALTTADFRFGARPWELTEVPSIDPHDAAGSNISLSTRLDRDFGGRAMIKRVMPRQNEFVNEIWISDKARFVHHFTRSDERLQSPQIRRGGAMRPTVWNEALPDVANALKAAEGDVAVLAGPGASNEDLWELKQLAKALGSERLGAWTTHAGAALAAQVGVGKGTNLGKLGKGDAVLVIASDLEEEVPMWFLRIKQAQDRGAYLVVANHRETRLAELARETERKVSTQTERKAIRGADVRYAAGGAVEWMRHIDAHAPEIAQKLREAANLVIVVGSEGLTLEGSAALTQAAANFLIESGHVGKPQNGLLPVLPGANGMGLHYMGYTVENTLSIVQNPPKVLIVAQCEPLNDDPTAAEWLSKVETLITMNLFPDRTIEHAAYALPIQSFAERDGTFTNGERRVQRFYTAQGPMGDSLALWDAAARLRERITGTRAKLSAAAVMLEISNNVPAFDGMRYKELAKVERQFPDVGGTDQYYGGTAYQNKGGLGLQIPSEADQGTVAVGAVNEVALSAGDGLLLIPTTRLYDRSTIVRQSAVIASRVAAPFVGLNPATAEKLNVADGDAVTVSFAGGHVTVTAHVSDAYAPDAAFLPRYLAAEPTPMLPTSAQIERATSVVAAL